MGHLHSASGCQCCEDMGVSFPFRQTAGQQPAERVSTQGMDHIYQETVEVTIDPEPAGPAFTKDAPEFGRLSDLVRQQAERLLDQSGRLEAASYRIGYLEAQLHQRDEQLKLLTAGRQSWAKSFTRWFLRSN